MSSFKLSRTLVISGLSLGLSLALTLGAHAAADIESLTPVTTETDPAIQPISAPLATPLPNLTTADEAGVSISLTAVPPRLGDDYNLIIQPGETIQTTVEVRNPGDVPILVETFAKDFIIADDGRTPLSVEVEQANPRWQMSQWLTLTPNTNIIEARGSATIIVTISAPADALPGGRYAMILHRPALATDNNAQSSGAQISTQVGTLLYVIVDGALTQKAEIENFKIAKLLETGPVPFSLQVRNDSSYHLRPELTLTITDVLGKTVETQKLEQLNIFPDSTREFTGEWKKNWGFGPYTAVVAGTYGKTQPQTLTAQTTFWLLPWKIILLSVAVLAGLILVLASHRRKYKQMLATEEDKIRKLDEKLKQANLTQKPTASSKPE